MTIAGASTLIPPQQSEALAFHIPRFWDQLAQPLARHSPRAPKENPMAWLPEAFVHPTVVTLRDGYHLRPIRACDVELDMPAVMGSRERLWSIYGQAWGWPPATMTAEQDREDLARHEAEAERHESFNYALLDTSESVLVGCVYIDPPEKAGADAEISWWVRDEYVGSDVQRALDDFVPGWIQREWPLKEPRYIGRDLTWQDWLTLP